VAREFEGNITQSVVDRLIDMEPREAVDPQFSRAKMLKEYRAAVRRDLQWLLNTRRINESAGPDMPVLQRSLFNYGLPDFSTYSLNSPGDRAQLTSHIEDTIEIFEPRLRDVKVTVLQSEGGDTRILRFKIEALLVMDPAPEQIFFDGIRDPGNGEFQLLGEK
jgi:type VI secretion system protein ImpF